MNQTQPTKLEAIAEILDRLGYNSDDCPKRDKLNGNHFTDLYEQFYDTSPPSRYSAPDLNRMVVFAAAAHAGVESEVDLTRYVMRHKTPRADTTCTADHLRLILDYLTELDRHDH